MCIYIHAAVGAAAVAAGVTRTVSTPVIVFELTVTPCVLLVFAHAG